MKNPSDKRSTSRRADEEDENYSDDRDEELSCHPQPCHHSTMPSSAAVTGIEVKHSVVGWFGSAESNR